MIAITLARKPLVGTVARNAAIHGTGGINIDACRIATTDSLFGGAYCGGARPTSAMGNTGEAGGKSSILEAGGGRLQPQQFSQPSGRWPPNVVLKAGAAVEALDEQSGVLKSGSRKEGEHRLMGFMGGDVLPMPEVQGDEGGASRFFMRFGVGGES